MNATTPEFSGLTYHTVAQIVGPTAAMLLIQIDHEHLEYGKNWRMIGGRQVFTETGLELIANELHARGHDGAAVQLRTAVRQAIAAERATTPVSRQDHELVGHKDWLGKWEDAHEA